MFEKIECMTAVNSVSGEKTSASETPPSDLANTLLEMRDANLVKETHLALALKEKDGDEEEEEEDDEDGLINEMDDDDDNEVEEAAMYERNPMSSSPLPETKRIEENEDEMDEDENEKLHPPLPLNKSSECDPLSTSSSSNHKLINHHHHHNNRHTMVKRPKRLNKFYHSVPFKCPFCFTFKEMPTEFIEHLGTSHYADVKMLYERKSSKFIIEQSTLRNKFLLNNHNNTNKLVRRLGQKKLKPRSFNDDEDDEDDDNDDDDEENDDDEDDDENEEDLHESKDESKEVCESMMMVPVIENESAIDLTKSSTSVIATQRDVEEAATGSLVEIEATTTPPQTPSHTQSPSSSPKETLKSSYSSINSSLLPPRKQQRLLKSPILDNDDENNNNNNNNTSLSNEKTTSSSQSQKNYYFNNSFSTTNNSNNNSELSLSTINNNSLLELSSQKNHYTSQLVMAAASTSSSSQFMHFNNNNNNNNNNIDSSPSSNLTGTHSNASNNNNNNNSSGQEASMRCAICDRGFEYYSNLRRHIKTKHKIFGKQVKEYVIRNSHTNATNPTTTNNNNGSSSSSSSSSCSSSIISPQTSSNQSLRNIKNELVTSSTSSLSSSTSTLSASSSSKLNTSTNANNSDLNSNNHTKNISTPSSSSSSSSLSSTNPYMDVQQQQSLELHHNNSPLSSLSSSSLSSNRSSKKNSFSLIGNRVLTANRKANDVDEVTEDENADVTSLSPNQNLFQNPLQYTHHNLNAAMAAIAAAAAAAAAAAQSTNPMHLQQQQQQQQQLASFFNANSNSMSKIKTSLIESLLTRKLPRDQSIETPPPPPPPQQQQHFIESNPHLAANSLFLQQQQQQTQKINNLTKLLQNIAEMNQLNSSGNTLPSRTPSQSSSSSSSSSSSVSSSSSSSSSPSTHHNQQLIESFEKQYNIPLKHLLLNANNSNLIDLKKNSLQEQQQTNIDDDLKNKDLNDNNKQHEDEMNNNESKSRLGRSFHAFHPPTMNKNSESTGCLTNDDLESSSQSSTSSLNQRNAVHHHHHHHQNNRSQNEANDDIDVDIYDEDELVGNGGKVNGKNGSCYYEERNNNIDGEDSHHHHQREVDVNDEEINDDYGENDEEIRSSISRSSTYSLSNIKQQHQQQQQQQHQKLLASLANGNVNSQLALENHFRNLHHQQHQHLHHHGNQRNFTAINGMILQGIQQQQHQQTIQHLSARFNIEQGGSGCVRRKKSKDNFSQQSLLAAASLLPQSAQTSQMVQSMRNLQCSPIQQTNNKSSLECITPPPPLLMQSGGSANSSSTTPTPTDPNQIRFSTEIWRCPYCCYETTSASRYNSHLVCHGWKPYLCPHCGSRSNRLPDMRTHISTFHPEFNVNTFVVLSEEEAKSTLKDYMKNRALINRKLKEMRPQPKFKCKLCPYASLYQFNLTKHVKSVHLSDVYNNNNANNNNNAANLINNINDS